MKFPTRTAAVLTGVFLTAATAFAAEEPAPAADQPVPSGSLERMHLKNAKCVWTQEIGNHIYQCLKENFGMNAHWCHNEAMELYCPKQLDSVNAGTTAKPN